MKVMSTNRIAIQWILFFLIYYIQCDLASALANKTAKQTVINRIVKGSAATRHIPYIASIQRQELNSQSRLYWQHACGGSIIQEHYVLTAAHCIPRDYNLNALSVYVGSLSWSTDGIRFDISSIVRHPEYTVTGSPGDIAVLKTNSPFAWSNNVQKIEFRSNNIVGTGVHCEISGWGWTQLNPNILSDILQVTQADTQSSARCEASFRLFESQKQLCTLAESVACFADSGGPLTSTARNLLIGVISTGNTMCTPNNPIKHVRVSAYVAWIENLLRTL